MFKLGRKLNSAWSSWLFVAAMNVPLLATYSSRSCAVIESSVCGTNRSPQRLLFAGCNQCLSVRQGLSRMLYCPKELYNTCLYSIHAPKGRV